MTRVSLKEAYDNKDVVAQIFAIRDIAEGAEDTADSAVTTANTASAHVDELVPQVEGAVQNANNASASAQASAQTVAGYENRLSAVEGETAGLDSDLNAVTLRVTTAEGQIVTIQGRVTALEGADAQNVKLAGPQTITGIKTVPTEPTGSLSQQIANSAKIGAELDNYGPMVRTTGNQDVAGEKKFIGAIINQRPNYSAFVLRNTSADCVTPDGAEHLFNINFQDKNGVSMASIRAGIGSNGKCSIGGTIRNTDGTTKYFTIALGD